MIATMVDRLLAQLQNRGLEVVPGDVPGQLKLIGRTKDVDAETLNAIRTFKADLLARVAKDRAKSEPPAPKSEPAPADPEPERSCGKCQQTLGPKGECWTCHDRPCATCRKPTGSAFLSMCWACGVNEDKAEETLRRGTTSRTPTSASPTRSGTAAPTT